MRRIHFFLLPNLLGFVAIKAQSAMELVRSSQVAEMIQYDIHRLQNLNYSRVAKK